ncbi:hypothetical protein PRIPAC_80224 [Pristionchus pacificus]|uniref:G protein-coupled receptor n=1 Tax=Pristionchus pacificus TaxID=54126 RepID=A0A2A6CMV5_PRIPA|nr:hypothetical protein PRIPAC_80224 [Pristionchus pacificus]|eukprot:PDM79532.1 G protein-coupled receptor [Pristionchus pacificus]
MFWFLLATAQFPHPLPAADFIAISLQCAIDWGGMVGNTAVFLAIVLRSPASWRSFKILLAKQAVVDLVSVIACNFNIERMIPSPIGTAMVFLGPCTIISPSACHTAHGVMMNLQTYSYYVVAACFFYRLYILKRWATVDNRKKNTHCITVLSLFIVDDEYEVRVAFKPIYNLDQYVVQGHIHPRLALTISTLYNVGSCWPITLIVFTVRRKVHVMKWINAKVLSKVLGTLEKQKVTMSAKTLDMHRVLVKILTLHACLPIINTLAVTCYVIGKAGHNSILIEHAQWLVICEFSVLRMLMISSLMALISPYISIISIKTFRDFVCCRSRKVSMKFTLNHLSA